MIVELTRCHDAPGLGPRACPRRNQSTAHWAAARLRVPMTPAARRDHRPCGCMSACSRDPSFAVCASVSLHGGVIGAMSPLAHRCEIRLTVPLSSARAHCDATTTLHHRDERSSAWMADKQACVCVLTLCAVEGTASIHHSDAAAADRTERREGDEDRRAPLAAPARPSRSLRITLRSHTGMKHPSRWDVAHTLESRALLCVPPQPCARSLPSASARASPPSPLRPQSFFFS